MIVRGVASSALFIARSSLAFECRRGIGTSGMHESANVRVTPGGKTAATIAAGFSSPLGTQVEGNAPKGSAQGLLGLTPELGAVFPSGPLATWSVEDVAARVCALGRELAHDVGTRENDIAADFDAHADKFRESGVDGETLSRVTVAMLQNDLGVSVYEHRAKIVGWVKDHLERELASPSGADTPEPPAITGSPADSRDAAIANLSLKLRDARLELSAALDAAAAPGSSGSEDATLEADLAEANERLCQYASDVSQARECLREATLENARLKNALEAFDDLVPGLRASNDALREETSASLARLASEFDAAVATARAETERAVVEADRRVASATSETAFQEERNRALLLRNRELRARVLDAKGTIRVFARIRPIAAGAEGDETVPAVTACASSDPAAEGEDVACAPPGPNGHADHSHERRPAGKRREEKRFGFDRVFGPAATQADVYAEVSPLVLGVLDGYDACVFAYGQTGSGKTHTMDGARRLPEDADSPGVNQRALTELFETAEARKNADGTLFRISVEMREIYNEQVRDLLRPAREDASWKGGSSGSRNLHSGGASARSSGGPGTTTGASDASDADDEVARVDARDAAHVLAIMSEGIARRASSATALNERSSRSHCVVTVRCVGTDLASGRASNGRLHLVDLAGSERVARSEARGDRLREAQHINKSLSALGDVVSALLEKRAHVPFRNSRLTRLLADSLGGNSRVLMLAHLAPEPASFPETQSTLVFAKRCSQLELGRARANASAPAADAAALHAAVAECRAELDAQKRRALEAEAEAERYKAEAEALRCRLERATSRERTPPREREPLSPIAGANGQAPFGTGPVATTPARTPSAAKRALGRAAATAASSILMRDR